MYIKPPGMAAQEEAESKQHQQAMKAEAEQSTRTNSDAQQGDGSGTRHFRPKTREERGQGMKGLSRECHVACCAPVTTLMSACML